MASILEQRASDLNSGSAGRRSSERCTTYKRASLLPVSDLLEVIVHDFSPNGLMATSCTEVALPSALHVSLDGRNFVDGRISWRDGSRFGLRCDVSEQCSTADMPPLQTVPPETERRSASRYPSALRASVVLTDSLINAIARNVSAGGAMIETATGLPVGMTVMLQFSGRPATLAKVQWNDGMNSGLRFVQAPGAEVEPPSPPSR